MKFVVKNPRENMANLARKLGYRLLPGGTQEFNCIRPIAGTPYPRFHLFIIKQKDELALSLHLDQKKPSYSGATAHSGEYDGDLIEGEAMRIKQIIGKLM